MFLIFIQKLFQYWLQSLIYKGNVHGSTTYSIIVCLKSTQILFLNVGELLVITY